MLKNRKITVTIILLLAVIFLLPHLARAADNADLYYGVNDLVQQGARLANTDLRTLIATIINVFLGFLGVIGVVIVIYGGFKWMTSGGEAKKIADAKKIITNGAIGLAIVLAAYGLVFFIFQVIRGDFFTGGPGGPGNPPGYSGGAGLGAGALESHYPARGATGIPRNTMIYVTFKEPMKLDFIVDNPAILCDSAHPGTLCDSKNINIKLINLTTNQALPNADLKVSYSLDKKVFQFDPFGDRNDPAAYLGVDNASTGYKMVLDGLKTETDRNAVPITNLYSWNFTVSSVLDLTPPTVVSVMPSPNSTVAPNAVVQINFSEAIMPSDVAGRYDGPVPPTNFTNIEMTAGAAIINGEYQISNQYRTVEFITDLLCGQNSCGGDVFCLPQSQQIDGTVKGAVIRDMAGNKLDGNDDGTPGDNYEWLFNTTNSVDLNAPVVSKMDPTNGASLTEAVKVEFSKNLLSSSIKSPNIDLVEDPAVPLNFWTSLDTDGKTVLIHHDRFKPLTDYHPLMTAGIKDNLQNCWFPCICQAADASCRCDDGPCAGNFCQGS
ncbi:MAG: hypothetical protein C3F02_03830 [Parcubacteria group bacterium]|nr:MAG: hypothetical protein C3F02_03830 [Parcubacteria group bacterium]